MNDKQLTSLVLLGLLAFVFWLYNTNRIYSILDVIKTDNTAPAATGTSGTGGTYNPPVALPNGGTDVYPSHTPTIQKTENNSNPYSLGNVINGFPTIDANGTLQNVYQNAGAISMGLIEGLGYV